MSALLRVHSPAWQSDGDQGKPQGDIITLQESFGFTIEFLAILRDMCFHVQVFLGLMSHGNQR